MSRSWLVCHLRPLYSSVVVILISLTRPRACGLAWQDHAWADCSTKPVRVLAVLRVLPTLDRTTRAASLTNRVSSPRTVPVQIVSLEGRDGSIVGTGSRGFFRPSKAPSHGLTKTTRGGGAGCVAFLCQLTEVTIRTRNEGSDRLVPMVGRSG